MGIWQTPWVRSPFSWLYLTYFFQCRVSCSLRWQVFDCKGSRPSMPQYGWCFHNPVLFPQNLVLYGCLSVCSILSTFRNAADFIVSKGLDAKQAEFATRKYKQHWQVGTIAKVLDVMRLQEEHKGVLANLWSGPQAGEEVLDSAQRPYSIFLILGANFPGHNFFIRDIKISSSRTAALHG
jgi:hypothetical protein